MSVVPFSSRKMVEQARVIPAGSSGEQQDTGPVQEAIGRLQDEVRWLQAELMRTRRALAHREVLLRNSQQREIELRSEDGVRWTVSGDSISPPELPDMVLL